MATEDNLISYFQAHPSVEGDDAFYGNYRNYHPSDYMVSVELASSDDRFNRLVASKMFTPISKAPKLAQEYMLKDPEVVKIISDRFEKTGEEAEEGVLQALIEAEAEWRQDHDVEDVTRHAEDILSMCFDARCFNKPVETEEFIMSHPTWTKAQAELQLMKDDDVFGVHSQLLQYVSESPLTHVDTLQELAVDRAYSTKESLQESVQKNLENSARFVGNQEFLIDQYDAKIFDELKEARQWEDDLEAAEWANADLASSDEYQYEARKRADEASLEAFERAWESRINRDETAANLEARGEEQPASTPAVVPDEEVQRTRWEAWRDHLTERRKNREAEQQRQQGMEL